MKYILVLILILNIFTLAYAEDISAIKLARIKYSGGGDWYNDQSAEVNLLEYVRNHTNINVNPKYEFVDLTSDDLFKYPLIFLTGHGNMKLTDREVKNLRAYLENGGFLYADDDYGLDKFFREEMKRVFPNESFVELPFSHPIFNCHFKFPNGVPKTHEHDDKRPAAYGLFYNNKLCVFYTFESNPSDGWADKEVHSDSQEKREMSLKFGTNIIVFALTY